MKLKYFSNVEWALWLSSLLFIIISFLAFGGDGYLTLVASLVGATSLIYCAKGNPIGQVLMIIFGALYGVISYSFAYFGEMITYLGMTVPMAIVALVTWLKNPYKNNKSEVAVNKISKQEIVFMLCLSVLVTIIFYFILKALGTSNLLPSTVSVTTSFIAAYLTFRRSPYFAFVYALNDIVLIVLWVLASIRDMSYVSAVVCFIIFLFNDLYGFISWKRMQKRQSA
ncbi:MAG: nicotinamide mononucleotide transporter [Clostridia bacterium]|nr:nicotinamide mononucleotide transporter [Clostridia bacterium]MBR4117017.1 nicotinamide mononucleotide transporter [Clostridia bacterium]